MRNLCVADGAFHHPITFAKRHCSDPATSCGNPLALMGPVVTPRWQASASVQNVGQLTIVPLIYPYRASPWDGHSCPSVPPHARGPKPRCSESQAEAPKLRSPHMVRCLSRWFIDLPHARQQDPCKEYRPANVSPLNHRILAKIKASMRQGGFPRRAP